MEAGLPSAVLMERAALAVVEEMENHSYDLSRVCVAVGTGNNGGDGAAIARLLAEKGFHPTIVCVGNPEKRSEMCRLQLQIAEHYAVERAESIETGKYSLVVDSVFGIGLTREITGAFADCIEGINQAGCPVIAVDIPSGLQTDTGAVLGTAVQADLTVTFARGKNGLYLGQGKRYAGEVIVREIGIPIRQEILQAAEKQRLFAVDEEDLRCLPARDPLGNKGTFGKVLVVAGSETMFGAAYLCARAALLTGVGMVRVFTAAVNRAPLAALLPETLITTYNAGCLKAETLEEAIAWADLVIAGPGMGTDRTAEDILQILLKKNSHPLVLDADALNLMAKKPAYWEQLSVPCVITPHMGEMARLTGSSIFGLKSDPLGAALDLAGRRDLICVLKDACTVIAAPDGLCFLNLSGDSSLSTAGSGDVLAGLIGGFLTQYGISPGIVADAVYLHGKCGEKAGEKLGKASVTAGDLLSEVPEILKDCAENIL